MTLRVSISLAAIAALLLPMKVEARMQNDVYLQGSINISTRQTRFQHKGKSYSFSSQGLALSALRKILIKEEGYSKSAAEDVQRMLRKLSRLSPDLTAQDRFAIGVGPGPTPEKPYSVLTVDQLDNDITFVLSDSDADFDSYKQELGKIINRRGGEACKLISNGCIKCSSKIHCLLSK